MNYKYTKGAIRREISPGRIEYLPLEYNGTEEWRELKAWLDAGNSIEPADPEPVTPDWRGFLASLRGTAVFSALRGRARNDVAANALATELRTVLGEAALGMPDPEVIQGLLAELLPTLTSPQVSEIEAAIEANNVPLTIV